MSDEAKRRKLSLKITQKQQTKHSSFSDIQGGDTKQLQEIPVSVPSGDNRLVRDAVVCSSQTENEAGQKLRDFMLQVTDSYPIDFSPLPPYQVTPKRGSQADDSTNVSSYGSSEVWTPLPRPCSECRKHKLRLHVHHISNEWRKEVELLLHSSRTKPLEVSVVEKQEICSFTDNQQRLKPPSSQPSTSNIQETGTHLAMYNCVTPQLQNLLQNCPLCQQKFSQSMGQMEIDGHIAACVAAADDDVTW